MLSSSTFCGKLHTKKKKEEGERRAGRKEKQNKKKKRFLTGRRRSDIKATWHQAIVVQAWAAARKNKGWRAGKGARSHAARSLCRAAAWRMPSPCIPTYGSTFYHACPAPAPNARPSLISLLFFYTSIIVLSFLERCAHYLAFSIIVSL